MTFIHKALSGSQTVELFDRTARRAEGRIRRALLDALERVRDRETAAELQRLVEARKPNAILDLLDVGKGDDFIAFRAAISEAVSDGAKLTVRAQPPVEGPDGRKIEFIFDSQNPRLATYAQQISGTRIREIGNDVREVIRTIVAQDTVNGINPRDTARRIKDSIGLTARQEAAVVNYRRALETMDPAALERELRDKRSDGAVRRAIADQKRLSKKQIDGMVERYRQKYLRYRARTIARTEATRSLNGANHELFQSYIDEGKIAKEQVRRFWTPTLDERTRMGHLEIPQIPGNENGVGQDEPFQSRFGPIMYPGDPNARPDNTINCRCTVFSRIVSMELLRPRENRPPVQPDLPLVPTPDVGGMAAIMATRPIHEQRWMEKAMEKTDATRVKFLQNLEDKLGSIENTIGETAFYNPSRNYIEMGYEHPDPGSAPDQTVFRHEYGHYVDSRLKRQLRGDKQGWISFEAVDDVGADGKDLLNTRSQRYGNAKDTERARALDEKNTKYQYGLRKKLDEGMDFDDEVRKRGLTPEQVRSDFGVSQSVGQARFLTAWDKNDHALLMANTNWSKGHASIMAGLSDSIEAATNVKFSYKYGHGKSYYRRFNAFAAYIGETKTINRQKYNNGHTTQIFANWFEAYTSGNETQLAIFERFLPRTSKTFRRIVEEANERL